MKILGAFPLAVESPAIAGFLLLTLIGLSVWWAVATRQARSKRKLVTRIYKFMDELLGAKRFETERSATRRHWLTQLGLKDLADLLYPSPRIGGAVVLPRYTRIRRYVEIDWPSLPPLKPYRTHHIRYATIRLRWSTEAPVNTGSFFEQIERGKPQTGGGLAAALGLEWTPGLFHQQRDFARGTVTLTAQKPVAAPKVRRDAEKELG